MPSDAWLPNKQSESLTIGPPTVIFVLPVNLRPQCLFYVSLSRVSVSKIFTVWIRYTLSHCKCTYSTCARLILAVGARHTARRAVIHQLFGWNQWNEDHISSMTGRKCSPLCFLTYWSKLVTLRRSTECIWRQLPQSVLGSGSVRLSLVPLK